MAIAALQTILDRIDSWPEERQEVAAELLETRDSAGDLQVSDEDLAEIDQRLASPNEPSLSFEEFRSDFRDFLK